MKQERPILTQEQLDFAKNRTNFDHPISHFLTNTATDIEKLHTALKKLPSNEHETFIEQEWSLLAQTCVEAGPFTLSPEELISLWSHPEIQQLTLYEKYSMARIIGACYSIQEIPNPEWQQFPIVLIKGIGHTYEFLREQEDIDEVGPYIVERTKDINKMTSILSASALAQTAITELSKPNANQFLYEISENFGNGLVPILWTIDAVLKE